MNTRRWRVVVAVTAVLLAGAATAHGQSQSSNVVVDRAPTMSGTARAGQTLTASGGHWSGPNGTHATWAWLRCSGNTPNTTVNKAQASQLNGCSIVHTDSSSYALTGDDVNNYVRLVLYASYGSGRNTQDDFMATAPSAKVAAAAPAATPAPTPRPPVVPAPTATPVPTVAPTPPPTFDPQPVTPVPTSGQILHETTRHAIHPFPVVRMKGHLTAAGAHVTTFTVRAPKTASIRVTCSGPCPARHWSKSARKSRLTRLAPFERVLRAGATITVSITRHGYIGKQTVFKIRRGQAPLRTDRCVTASRHRTSCSA